MGMAAAKSHFSFTRRLTPSPSLPITTPIGPVRFRLYISSPPISAGALNYTPVAKVSNLGQTIEELKKEGMWFVCADMGGDLMYNLNLTGPMGVVIGNEGEGVSRLVKEKCDFVAAIPMKGDIDSLNASVAAGILAYEVVRQRMK